MSLRICPRCDARFRGDIATCPIDGSGLLEPADPFLGRTIAGRYLIEERLGSGGMGSVYRARHQIIGRDVALKFLDPSLCTNERQRKRFLGEARAANQIDHEHIIDITDFGETEDGLVYMVMEYLEGQTLSEVIDRGPLHPRRALRIAMQVALGLARAHELGVVHRDIKPSNIYLVKRKADPDYVKVLDFGVARSERDIRITGQGSIVGTPEYIAPEQIQSSTALPSADMYSLGCVLFEMLTGQLPFDGKTTQLLVKHLNEPPPRPSEFAPGLTPGLDELVLRMLRKEPAQRFRDAYHFVESVQRLLDELPFVNARGPDAISGERAEPLPELPAPSEEESVYRAVELYRARLTEQQSAGPVPSWLPRAIEQLEHGVGEVRSLRRELRQIAARATAHEEEARGPRARIGRALDELAQDDSRLTRQIERLRRASDLAYAHLETVLRGVCEAAAQPIASKPGSVLGEREAQALQKLVEGARKLSSEHERVSALRSELEAREREHRDLRFQIGELKQQLTAANGAHTLEQQLAHDEVTRVSTQIQAKLEQLAPYAERVSRYFEAPGAPEAARGGASPTGEHVL